MVAPRGDGQKQIGIKVPARTLRQIDDLIESGEYGSRSLFVKDAIDRLLNQDRTREEARNAIREELRSGEYDDLIEERVRNIFGRIVQQQES